MTTHAAANHNVGPDDEPVVGSATLSPARPAVVVTAVEDDAAAAGVLVVLLGPVVGAATSVGVGPAMKVKSSTLLLTLVITYLIC